MVIKEMALREKKIRWFWCLKDKDGFGV